MWVTKAFAPLLYQDLRLPLLGQSGLEGQLCEDLSVGGFARRRLTMQWR